MPWNGYSTVMIPCHFRIEYSENRKSVCRQCRCRIAKGDIRVAEHFIARSQYWHSKCYNFRKNGHPPGALDGFHDLHWDDQCKLDRYGKYRRASSMAASEAVVPLAPQRTQGTLSFMVDVNETRCKAASLAAGDYILMHQESRHIPVAKVLLQTRKAAHVGTVAREYVVPLQLTPGETYYAQIIQVIRNTTTVTKIVCKIDFANCTKKLVLPIMNRFARIAAAEPAPKASASSASPAKATTAAAKPAPKESTNPVSVPLAAAASAALNPAPGAGSATKAATSTSASSPIRQENVFSDRCRTPPTNKRNHDLSVTPTSVARLPLLSNNSAASVSSRPIRNPARTVAPAPSSQMISNVAAFQPATPAPDNSTTTTMATPSATGAPTPTTRAGAQNHLTRVTPGMATPAKGSAVLPTGAPATRTPPRKICNPYAKKSPTKNNYSTPTSPLLLLSSTGSSQPSTARSTTTMESVTPNALHHSSPIKNPYTKTSVIGGLESSFSMPHVAAEQTALPQGVQVPVASKIENPYAKRKAAPCSISQSPDPCSHKQPKVKETTSESQPTPMPMLQTNPYHTPTRPIVKNPYLKMPASSSANKEQQQTPLITASVTTSTAAATTTTSPRPILQWNPYVTPIRPTTNPYLNSAKPQEPQQEQEPTPLATAVSVTNLRSAKPQQQQEQQTPVATTASVTTTTTTRTSPKPLSQCHPYHHTPIHPIANPYLSSAKPQQEEQTPLAAVTDDYHSPKRNTPYTKSPKNVVPANQSPEAPSNTGINFFIVGRNYRQDVTLNGKVLLERDNSNPHDANAIRVLDPETGEIGGFVKKETAKKLAPQLDTQHGCKTVQAWTTGPDDGFMIPARIMAWPPATRRSDDDEITGR